MLLTASLVYGSHRPRPFASGGSHVRTPAVQSRAFVWTAFLAAIASILGILILPGSARADAGSSLVSSANQARASAGLPPLAYSADLTAAASHQAASMASSGVLAHTPNLGSAVCCWVNLGENVGDGPSASAIQSAFMASPGHRANILSSAYTQIGVGYVVDGRGTLWVSEIFRRPNGAAAAAPRPVVAKPAPARPAVVHPVAPAPAAAPAPVVDPGLAASRDLTRLSLEDAQRYAAQFAADGPPRGSNPLSRLLDFAAKAAAPN